MTGAELLVRCLTEAGIDEISVLCGNGLNPLLTEAKRAGFRLTDTRNEQSASYMADAYARMTRRLGVCAVSSAVGHTNALIGVVNSMFDGSPMLLISGYSYRDHDGMGVFQEFNQVALADPITKYAKLVEKPETIPFYVREAISIATSGRPGPVHLTISWDVLEAQVPEDKIIAQRQPPAYVRQNGLANPTSVRDAVRLLSNSKKPLLVAGSGLFYANAGTSLAELAQQLSLPVVTPIWDRGVVEQESPWFFGVIGSASGSPKLLNQADLVILAGSRVDYRIGYGQEPDFPKSAKVIRISADSSELSQGIVPDVSLLGDPSLILKQLTEEARKQSLPGFASWLDEASHCNRAFRYRWVEEAAPAQPPMTGRHVVDAIRPFLDDKTVFLVDGGNIGQWAHMALAEHRYPSHWLTCGASGVVGWGLPGAMAARIAYPERPIILLSGDGSFTFTLGELECASRQNLPFVVVLADDCAWGIVVSGQSKTYGESGIVCSRIGHIDYVKLAEALGCIGVEAESPDEISQAIKQGLAADRPTIIHVSIVTGGPAD